MDMVFVLKTVITDIERHPPEGFESDIAIRELPIYCVVTRALTVDLQDKMVLSSVLYNLYRYLHITQPFPLSNTVISEFANFMGQLSRRTTGWKSDELDTRPILAMASLVIREHPEYYDTLVGPCISFFRVALQHFEVPKDILYDIIHAYRDAFFETLDNVEDTLKFKNPFVISLFTDLMGCLSGNNMMAPATGANCLELVTMDIKMLGMQDYVRLFGESHITKLATACISFLKKPISERLGEDHFYMAAAIFLATCIEHKLVHMSEILVEMVSKMSFV
jgi:hypothetical protein